MVMKFKSTVASVNGKQEQIQQDPPKEQKASSDPAKALSDANVKTTFGTPTKQD